MRRATRCAGQRLYWVPNGYIGTLSPRVSGPSHQGPPQASATARHRRGADWWAARARQSAWLGRHRSGGRLARILADSETSDRWLVAGWLAEIFTLRSEILRRQPHERGWGDIVVDLRRLEIPPA